MTQILHMFPGLTAEELDNIATQIGPVASDLAISEAVESDTVNGTPVMDLGFDPTLNNVLFSDGGAVVRYQMASPRGVESWRAEADGQAWLGALISELKNRGY